MKTSEIGGQIVLEHEQDDPVIESVAQVLDLIGSTSAAEAGIVLVPAGRLSPEFFRLRSGFAGEAMQKFQTYHVRLIVYGDISEYVSASTALRDFVQETNRVGHHFFAKDRETAEAAIGGEPG